VWASALQCSRSAFQSRNAKARFPCLLVLAVNLNICFRNVVKETHLDDGLACIKWGDRGERTVEHMSASRKPFEEGRICAEESAKSKLRRSAIILDLYSPCPKQFRCTNSPKVQVLTIHSSRKIVALRASHCLSRYLATTSELPLGRLS